MRPVERGPCPKDANGVDLVFAEYGHARPYLIERLGDYCSFCEMPLPTPDVEHIRHKDGNPDLERTWSNFLLSCKSCNSTKGTQVDSEADVAARLWPDQDRSFEAYVYESGGVVRLATTVDKEFAGRAASTARLVGLFKRPNHGLTTEQLKRASDRRYVKRSEAWDEACESLEDLNRSDTPEMRRQILKTVRARGFWSVWMTVFRHDAQMLAVLCELEHFPGTAMGRLMPPPVAAQSPSATATAAPTVPAGTKESL